MHKHMSPHGDYNHMGEAFNLITNFRVEKVIFNCGELNIDKNKLYFLQTEEYDNENVIIIELDDYKFIFNEINPKYSIISVGKNNRYGHPNKGVLNNLENSEIYRTDEDGSIMFKIKNNELKIEICSS